MAAHEHPYIAAMVAGVADQPGALPLLQYTLTELFDARQHNMMTLAAYKTFGGVAGALAKRAEEIYAGFDEAEQAATRQLMLRLVALGEGVEDTRRRVLFSELLSVIGPEESRANHSQPAATPPTVYPSAPGDGLRSSIATVIDGWVGRGC